MLTLWLAGAAVIYVVTFHYINDNNDANLNRIAQVLEQTVAESNADKRPLSEAELDGIIRLLFKTAPSGRMSYAIDTSNGILNHGKPLEAFNLQLNSVEAVKSFATIERNGKSYRILKLYLPANTTKNTPGVWIEISKELHEQANSLRAFLYRMALPLMLMMLITSVLIGYGVKNTLRPLLALKQMVETRQAQDLSPLSLDNAPEEIDALSSALNQLLASTEESISRQRRFIADAAHQLRTPLAGLKSQTELAMRESSPEGLRERLNMVHTSATRSIHLVNQLLTLARSEPGSINGIPKVKMDLARLVRDLTSELVPRALAARIDLGCDCLVQEAWIEGNSALLRELFINLVENAIKYIPRDGSVTVRLTENVTQYIVDVEDNGDGIPDVDKPRVFERFFRREQTGNGCGLGMAIVREIVERHSGTVELLDAVPHGLIVHVVLPKNLAST
ncbi:sensor histidine kinase [Chitinibacter sp. SCUT-21]|uniref:sensor histidine kinase n=1 Tax=Chitinibacter sp. SCUT-21 TaxID=2970891 RepID=UPI0035A6409F